MRAARATLADIAEDIRRRRQIAVEAPAPSKRDSRRASIADPFEATIRQLAAQGCCDPEIGRVTGLHESTIGSARKRWGIAPRPRGGRHKPVLPDAPDAEPIAKYLRYDSEFGVRFGKEDEFAALMAGRRFESLSLRSGRGYMPAKPPSLERGAAS